MERELPRYMIGKDEFEVDMRAGELRLLADRSKSLALFKMDQRDGKFEFIYDHVSKQIVTRGYKIGDDHRQQLETIKVPVIALDPKFFKEIEREGKEEERLIRSGKSIYNQQDGIHAWKPHGVPKAGPLPIIKLYGTEFYLDLRLAELRQVDDHTNAIPFKKLEPEEFHFTLLYDTKTRNAFNGSLIQAVPRNDVKLLLLPPLDRMIKDGLKLREEKVNQLFPKPSFFERFVRTRKKGRGI